MELPNIITIASPDKLSICMFLSYIQGILGKDWLLKETNTLMFKKDLEVCLEGLFNISKKCIITYYARKKINISPENVIPEILLNKSEFVVWFNLYSTNPVFVIDMPVFREFIEGSWNDYLKKLSHE